jgi:hypothetical protein
MGFYTERFPIPQVVAFVPTPVEGEEKTFKLDEASPPAFIQQREGLVRSVEICSYLDLDAAVRVHKWLGERIQQLQGANNVVDGNKK